MSEGTEPIQRVAFIEKPSIVRILIIGEIRMSRMKYIKSQPFRQIRVFIKKRVRMCDCILIKFLYTYGSILSPFTL